MTQMTTGQARVIDPILTSIARGYTHIFAPIANILFPMVPVQQRGGTVLEFGPEDFRLINTKRAPGAATKRVQFGHQGAPYALVNHSLEAVVPYEIQQETISIGVDQYQRSIRGVQRLMDIERENDAAVIATALGNYGADNKLEYTVAADRWDDTASDPVTDVSEAKSVVRSKIGVYPDTLTISPKVHKALRSHPDIIATLRDSDIKIATLQQIAMALDVERVVVGEASYYNGVEFVDVWGADAVLAFTKVATLSDGGSPAYGYTYQLEGHPFVEEAYDDRSHKSMVAPVTDARKPVLAGSVAGFLFKNVVNPA